MNNYDPLKKSIFYEDVVDRKQRITYLFLEVMENIGPALESMTAKEAVLYAADRSQLPDFNSEDEDAILRVINRMQEIREKFTSKVMSSSVKPQQQGQKRTYGSDFLSKYDKMSNADRCLYTANFDYEQALRLYCEFDVDVTEHLLTARIEWDFNTHYLGFEGVVYGMGGSFSGSNASTVDLETIEGQDKQDEAAIGFMARFAKRK
jgi:hypothetical protein